MYLSISGAKMKTFARNPWQVENMDAFSFWCCPECVYKSQDRDLFKEHAVDHHPKSSTLFEVKEVITKKPRTTIEDIPIVIAQDGPIKMDIESTNITLIDVKNHYNSEEVIDTVELTFEDGIDAVDIQTKIQNMMRESGSVHQHKNVQGVIPNEAIKVESYMDESQSIRMYEEQIMTKKKPEEPIYIGNDVVQKMANIVESKEMVGVYKCPLCRVDLPTQAEKKTHMISKHINMNGEMPTVYCPKCTRPFKNPFKVERGKECAVCQTEKYQCAYCDEKFPSKFFRNAHERMTHTDGAGDLLPAKCPYCEEVLKSSVHMRIHIMEAHKKVEKVAMNLKMDFSCQVCGKQFKNRACWYNHKRTHEKDENKDKFQCDECDFKTYLKKNLTNHITRHHRDKNIVCEDCGKRFVYNYQLRDHICTNSKEPGIKTSQQVPCPKCGYLHNSVIRMVKHHYVDHGELPPGHENQQIFMCDSCPQVFFKEVNLNQHKKKVHAGVLQPINLQCDICDQAFSVRRSYVRHYRRIHHAIPKEYLDKPTFPCDKCDLIYLSQQGLNTHNNIKHLGIKPVQLNSFKCHICGKSVSSKLRLNSHMIIAHSDERNFKCQVCDKAFPNYEYLKRHYKLSEQCRR